MSKEQESFAQWNSLRSEITRVGGRLATLATHLQDAETAEARNFMDAKGPSMPIDFTKLKAMLIEYEAASERYDAIRGKLGS